MPHHSPENGDRAPGARPPVPSSIEIELTLPVTIIIAALIIGGSVLYEARDLGARLGDLQRSPAIAQVSAAPVVPSAPAARANVPDPHRKVDVALGGTPVLGKKDVKVTNVEFSDLQCPFCERFDTETFPQLKKEYIDTGKARFAYRDSPISGPRQRVLSVRSKLSQVPVGTLAPDGSTPVS